MSHIMHGFPASPFSPFITIRISSSISGSIPFRFSASLLRFKCAIVFFFRLHAILFLMTLHYDSHFESYISLNPRSSHLSPPVSLPAFPHLIHTPSICILQSRKFSDVYGCTSIPVLIPLNSRTAALALYHHIDYCYWYLLSLFL